MAPVTDAPKPPKDADEDGRDRPAGDPDAPGVDVDDTTSEAVNEPNEPA